MLARLCSKFFKLGFISMWTENFQMYYLGFEETEEPEIKLPISIGSWGKRVSKIIYFCLIDYTKTLCESQKNVENKEMGLPEYIICLYWEICMGFQEATLRMLHWTTDWLKIKKAVFQGCILSPCLFNFYAECIMWNARLNESQAGIKIMGINSLNLR